jgi:hypothetical protein
MDRILPRLWPLHPPRQPRWQALAAACTLAVAATAAYAAGTGVSEQPFLAENDAAMNTMMSNMAIKPSGDIDSDFVGMMAPHHQGAIDMAQAELRYGHNEQLRRIAQEIIVEQQQGRPLPPSLASPDQPVSVAQPAAPAMAPMSAMPSMSSMTHHSMSTQKEP